MNVALEAISWALVWGGSAFCVIGALGLMRLRGFYPRTHAASVIDSAGAGLMLAGLMLPSGWTLSTAKLAIIGLLIFFTSPTATHALANAALARGLSPDPAGEDTPSKR